MPVTGFIGTGNTGTFSALSGFSTSSRTFNPTSIFPVTPTAGDLIVIAAGASIDQPNTVSVNYPTGWNAIQDFRCTAVTQYRYINVMWKKYEVTDNSSIALFNASTGAGYRAIGWLFSAPTNFSSDLIDGVNTNAESTTITLAISAYTVPLVVFGWVAGGSSGEVVLDPAGTELEGTTTGSDGSNITVDLGYKVYNSSPLETDVSCTDGNGVSGFIIKRT